MDENDLSVVGDQFAHARRQYTSLDKAKVYWQLHANGNNLKRTAREMNVPVPTLRAWRKKWDEGLDIPPVLPVEKSPYDPEEFDVELALKDLRIQTLLRLKEQILHTQSIDHLTKLLATIDRDLDRMQKPSREMGGSVNINVRLPSAEETAKLLSGLVDNTLGDIDKRHGEIIDMEAIDAPVEQPLTPLADLGYHTYAVRPDSTDDKE